MKKLLFLPSAFSWGLLALAIYCIVNLSFGQALLALIPLGMIAFAFRRHSVLMSETSRVEGEIFLSPVNGTVESIRQHVPIMSGDEIGHEVRISISIWDQKGLYLPTFGGVAYLKANKGRKIPRISGSEAFYGAMDEIAHTDLILASKSKTKTLMRFVDAPYGLRPDIWIKSGDRGRGAACFGYYPFGGTLLVYLPKNSDVLVYEAERLTPGQSVIAAIKDPK
jgi:hypothetical protein